MCVHVCIYSGFARVFLNICVYVNMCIFVYEYVRVCSMCMRAYLYVCMLLSLRLCVCTCNSDYEDMDETSSVGKSYSRERLVFDAQ